MAASQNPEAQAELESFRRQWQEEVSARSRQPQRSFDTTSNNQTAHAAPPSPERRKRAVPPPRPIKNRLDPNDGADEIEPKVHHDLPDKEAELRLGTTGDATARAASFREPRTALEHYELAVEKETAGVLGDSLELYRKAFKVRIFKGEGLPQNG